MSKTEDVAAAEAALAKALLESDTSGSDITAAIAAQAALDSAAEATKAVAPSVPKLDKSKPYGTVGGTDPDGAHFWQDGEYFDNQGKVI